jgi:hypothetical protein
LTQLLVPGIPSGLFIKELDAVSQGQPPCLCTLPATAILVAKADKLTLGQKLTVQVSHSVLTLIKYKENYWLTNT